MESMIKTQEEFLEVLKENKYFEDFEEQSLYNFRAVQYFLDHLSPIVINGERLTSKHVLQPKDDSSFKYTNLAFKSLRKRFGFE